MKKALTINHYDLKCSVFKQLCLCSLKETFTFQIQNQHYWFVMPSMAIFPQHWRLFGAFYVYWDNWVRISLSTLIFFKFQKNGQSQHLKSYLDRITQPKNDIDDALIFPKLCFVLWAGKRRWMDRCFVLYSRDFCLSHVLSNVLFVPSHVKNITGNTNKTNKSLWLNFSGTISNFQFITQKALKSYWQQQGLHSFTCSFRLPVDRWSVKSHTDSSRSTKWCKINTQWDIQLFAITRLSFENVHKTLAMLYRFLPSGGEMLAALVPSAKHSSQLLRGTAYYPYRAALS